MKSFMTTVQQAELQAKTLRIVQDCRQKYDLAPVAVFDALVSLCWELARSEAASSEEIANRMRSICEACEVALKHAARPTDPELAAQQLGAPLRRRLQ